MTSQLPLRAASFAALLRALALLLLLGQLCFEPLREVVVDVVIVPVLHRTPGRGCT